MQIKLSGPAPYSPLAKFVLIWGVVGGGHPPFANQNNGNHHPAKPIHYTTHQNLWPDSSTQQTSSALAYEYQHRIPFSQPTTPITPLILNTVLTDTKAKVLGKNGMPAQTSMARNYTIKSNSNAFPQSKLYWPQPTPWAFTKKCWWNGDIRIGKD